MSVSPAHTQPALEPKTKPRVPISNWGKDHWSTFAYVETRIVDYNGQVDRRHLRVLDQKHPAFAHGHPATSYPTQLRVLPSGGLETIPDHDDVDCIEDAVAEGLLLWEGTGRHPVFKLTDLGSKIAGELRAWKSKPMNNYCDFTPSTVVRPKTAEPEPQSL